MTKILVLLALFQLGSGSVVVKEPAKTATRYPVPANCQKMTITTHNYIINVSIQGKTEATIHDPIEIICEKD